MKYLKFVLADITSVQVEVSERVLCNFPYNTFNFVTLVADTCIWRPCRWHISARAPLATVGELDEERTHLYTACPRSSRMSVGKIKKHRKKFCCLRDLQEPCGGNRLQLNRTRNSSPVQKRPRFVSTYTNIPRYNGINIFRLGSTAAVVIRFGRRLIPEIAEEISGIHET